MRNDPRWKIPKSVEAVKGLASKGVGIAEDHEVTHRFIGDDIQIKELCRDLVAEGWNVLRVEPRDGEGRTGVVVSHPLSENAITGAINQCCKSANAIGIDYPSWGADVSRWHAKADGGEG